MVSGCRFVRAIFVEKFVARMLGVSEIGQFPAQDFYLFVSEEPNAGQVPVFMKEVDLIFGETKTAGISLYLRAEHRPDWIMKGRKVLHEASVSLEIRAFTEGRVLCSERRGTAIGTRRISFSVAVRTTCLVGAAAMERPRGLRRQ